MLINGQQPMGRLPGDNLDLSNSNHISLNQMHPSIGQLPNGLGMQMQSRGSISQHNTLSRRTGNGLVPTAAISNYATISRAAHGQLMNGTHHFLTGGQTVSPMLPNGTATTSLMQQIPGTLSHTSLANGTFYASSFTPNVSLNQSMHQSQMLGPHQSLYSSTPFLQQAPQFVGLEAHLELVDQSGCCCFSSRCRQRCSLSRVIAFICGIVVIFLMTLCIASSNWLTADKYRQGLWEFCLDDGAAQPLPFDLNVEPGCYPGRDVAYVRLAGILCFFGLIFDFFATVMTGFGLCSNNPHRKYTLYRFALYIMIASLIVILTALVIYPAYFASEIEISNRQVWEFGWAYGVGWGASIFLFGAVLLLLCDKETEEIYYKERTIVHNPHNGELKA